MPLKLVRRKGAPGFYVRGTVRGIRCFETTGTSDKAQAEAYRAKREAELYEESLYGKRAVVSFQRAALSYLDFEARPARTKDYIGRLVRHFGSMPLAKIDQLAAEKAVAALLEPDAAPATKARSVYVPLAAVLNHANRRGWCERPRFELPKLPPGKTRWLTPGEVMLLLESAAPHLRPLLLFIVCTGARMSEALDLDWSDVDLGAAKAVFRMTKNGAPRAASLPMDAVLALAALPGKTGPVFRRADGEPYADRFREGGGQIKTGWQGACSRAQITEATPHDLRHTWASWFYAVSKDTLLLKAEGGWNSIEMVERYAHLMPSDLVAEIASVWGASHPKLGVLPGANPMQDAAPSPKVMSALPA
jgi:integrase